MIYINGGWGSSEGGGQDIEEFVRCLTLNTLIGKFHPIGFRKFAESRLSCLFQAFPEVL